MSRDVTRYLLAGLPLLALLGSEGCSSPDHGSAAATGPVTPATAPAPAPAVTATTAAPAPAAMPTADELYQLAAPVALFPDRLLAQVLAASTHPDQVAALANMLQQNPGLTAAALQAALTPQPWDPAVKGLASFPGVLHQMAGSPAWMTALGQAYLSDPTDLMNAVQALRQRAVSQGHLKTTPQQTVVTRTVTTRTTTTSTRVPAPQAYVEIATAQPDVVYVPSYNPNIVYGEDFGTYPGYAAVTTYSDPGAVNGWIGFGAGIAIGALLSHPWGWSHWDMHWGGPPPPGQPWNGWQPPAVYYDQRHYDLRGARITQPSIEPGRFNRPAGPMAGPPGPPPPPPPPGFGGRPGGGFAPPGGHWRAPQFDPRLNTGHWASPPGQPPLPPGYRPAAAPGPGSREGGDWQRPSFQAHAGPEMAAGLYRPPMPAMHAHPVSYIHNDTMGPDRPAPERHVSTRPAGAPPFQPSPFEPTRAPHFSPPPSPVGVHYGTAAFRDNFRPAGQTFRPPMPEARPRPFAQPRPPSHPAPPAHAPAAEEHHHR